MEKYQTLKERVIDRITDYLPSGLSKDFERSVRLKKTNLYILFEAFWKAVDEEMVDKYVFLKYENKK